MKELSSRVNHFPGFGREEMCEVTLTYTDGDVVVERTMCKSALDGEGMRCWGMRWLGDETCSGDGMAVYRWQGEEVPGYLICAKHAAVWRETYRDRGPYTIRSWDGFGA